MPDAVDGQQHNYLGSGWAFPMRSSVQGGLQLSKEAKKVEESIWIILRTGIGERVYRPDFGSRLAELAFAPMNSETLMQARLYVLEALEVWEPRITIEQIIIEPYPVTGIDKSVGNSYSIKGGEGRLDIMIYYRLKDQPDIYSFVYPYYLASATQE
ncbi:baseplate protein [Calothrix sp. HK-06]|nr:baseplate protein [Calothrix sp. HK-06]